MMYIIIEKCINKTSITMEKCKICIAKIIEKCRKAVAVYVVQKDPGIYRRVLQVGAQ